MEIISGITSILGQAIQAPAFQGLIVAAATQAIKQAPVGPSGGPTVRFIAAALALASTVAAAAARGSLDSLDAGLVGQQLIDALGAFAAATGIWYSLKKE